MKHSVSHSLGKELASKAAKAAFDTYAQKFAEYNPQTTWKSDEQAEVSFSAKGMSLKADVQVTDSSIDVDMSVPFLMKPFQGKAIDLIDRTVKEWIEKAKNGELG